MSQRKRDTKFCQIQQPEKDKFVNQVMFSTCTLIPTSIPNYCDLHLVHAVTLGCDAVMAIFVLSGGYTVKVPSEMLAGAHDDGSRIQHALNNSADVVTFGAA